jgi:glutamate synthase domain-containing protein 2
MPDETSAIEVLTQQLAAAQQQISSLQQERSALENALADTGSERDALAEHMNNPDTMAERITELESLIRDRDHFDKFAELAKGAKAKDAALRHLWQVSGYKAEADEIDEVELKTLVSALKRDVAYAFDDDESSHVADAREAARPSNSRTKYGLELRGEAAAGAGRAARNEGADGTIVTQEMRADPKFMLDPKNRELIRDAAAQGRFR